MDGKWLTYAELGELMGCPAGAARARAIRRRWRRQTGNDGMARVLVPNGETLAPMRTRRVRPAVSGTDADTTPHTDAQTYSYESELLARLERLQAELTAMAQRLGASEAETTAAKAMLDELRQDRDAWRAQTETAQRQQNELRADRDIWRAQAERLAAVGSELQAAREERERLLGHSETMRERMARAEHDRDQALERLNHNIDRLDRVQAEHHTEVTAVREQLAQAKHDRDRLAAELEAHLRLPWWRRLFA